MIKTLIEQAQKVLVSTKPSDDELLHAQSELASFLDALSTGRMSVKVDIDDLEESERLMRELKREINRRQAGMPAQTPQAKPVFDTQAIPVTHQETSPTAIIPETPELVATPPPVFSQILQNDNLGGFDSDPLKRFFQSAHDPEAERLMDQAEEAFYKGNYQVAIPLYEKVIQMEPSWARAQEHHAEAEEYLRSGNIPSVALPPLKPVKLTVKRKVRRVYSAIKSRLITSMMPLTILKKPVLNAGAKVRTYALTLKTKCKLTTSTRKVLIFSVWAIYKPRSVKFKPPPVQLQSPPNTSTKPTKFARISAR